MNTALYNGAVGVQQVVPQTSSPSMNTDKGWGLRGWGRLTSHILLFLGTDALFSCWILY